MVEFDSPVPTTGRPGGRGAGPAPSFYPRGYKVEVSMDGRSWGSKPVAQGTGSGSHTAANLKLYQTMGTGK
jgi:hypothetical protein